MADRPPVSGSMAGHCRLEIWLAAHGYEKEPVQPGAQRTFDLGHIIEAAMFRGVDVPTGNIKPVLDGVDGTETGWNTEETQRVGPWWPNLGEVKDHATGQSFDAADATVTGYQREVAFAGYAGHIDGILAIPSGRYVLDCKSTQGFGYDRNLASSLLQDPFASEYVKQLHFYIQGLKDEGEAIEGGVLVYFNKENSQVCARFVPYDPAIVEEIRERLSWAKNEAEPEPDWKWEKGSEVPLRCRYCSLKQSCSGVRGIPIELGFTKKGKPTWIAK